MNKKAAGVMSAIKSRKDFGSKKGAGLLGIVEKLSAKRKAANAKKSGKKC